MLDASIEPWGINLHLIEIAKKITGRLGVTVFGVPVWPLAYMRKGSLSLTPSTNPG